MKGKRVCGSLESRESFRKALQTGINVSVSEAKIVR